MANPYNNTTGYVDPNIMLGYYYTDTSALDLQYYMPDDLSIMDNRYSTENQDIFQNNQEVSNIDMFGNDLSMPNITSRASTPVTTPAEDAIFTKLTDWFVNVKNAMIGNNESIQSEAAMKAYTRERQSEMTKVLNSDASSAEKKRAMNELNNIKQMNMQGKYTLDDSLKILTLLTGGAAAYYAYKADKRSEELADKSPEELGEEQARKSYAASKKYDELYDADNPSTGGDGGATASYSGLVGYTPGTIR